VAEFCRIDAVTCSTRTPTADFAMPSQHGIGDASQDWDDQEQASAVPSVTTLWECWAKWWGGDENVVFRNISRQIARLDWTLLLTGRPSGLAIRGTMPAENSVER
jgi:hypothetical protein